MLRVLVAGAVGALAIACVTVLTPDGALLNYLHVPDDELRRWSLWGLVVHFSLYLVAGATWIGVANNEASPWRAFQLGIAAPTALASLLSLTPASPAAIQAFDPKTPPQKQDACKFNHFDALLYGLYAWPLPSQDIASCQFMKASASPPALETAAVGPHDDQAVDRSPTDSASTIPDGSREAAAIQAALASPPASGSLSISDVVALQVDAAPDQKAPTVEALIDSLKPGSDATATVTNRTVARTLALINDWSASDQQVGQIRGLKDTEAYQTDETYKFWIDQALAASSAPSQVK